MPNYGSSNQGKLLYENSQVFLWNNELVVAGNLSISWELFRVSRSYYPWGLSAEVVFSGNPGVFEIDIMGANTDAAANFIQIGTITNAGSSIIAGAYVGRWDMPSYIWPKYIAGYIKTLTNAVNTTLAITR